MVRMTTATSAATKTRRAEPARRKPLRDGEDIVPKLRTLAYQAFSQQIVLGRLRPGQFISQRELVRVLDIPLGAVREMIPRLEAARLIVTVPQRGLQVAHVDLKLIRNAFQVRSMIEREAVSHFVRHVTDEELDSFEQRHRAVLERASSSKPDPTLDADAQAVDWGLHERIVDSMGNEILSEIYRVNSLHVRMIRLDAEQVLPMRVLPAMQEHMRFLEILRKRDEGAAQRAIAEHIESSRQRVLSAIWIGPGSQ